MMEEFYLEVSESLRDEFGEDSFSSDDFFVFAQKRGKYPKEAVSWALNHLLSEGIIIELGNMYQVN